MDNTSIFSFSNISVDHVMKKIRKLNTDIPVKILKQNTDIPVKILKQNTDIFGNYICDFFNHFVVRGVFPPILKNTNITPVFKKGFRSFKNIYRRVSILPIVSKIFENLLSE